MNKTAEQIAADKRHNQLTLSATKRRKPNNAQRIVIEPKRTQLLPNWK